eukprot:50291-Chlamydomonas_euryale.AAC.2
MHTGMFICRCLSPYFTHPHRQSQMRMRALFPFEAGTLASAARHRPANWSPLHTSQSISARFCSPSTTSEPLTASQSMNACFYDP